MATKTIHYRWIILGISTFILNACGLCFCPPTNNAPDIRFDINLLNRRDTIHVGDSIIFSSASPVLPFTFRDIVWDENAHFVYNFRVAKFYDTSSYELTDIVEPLFFGATQYHWVNLPSDKSHYEKSFVNNELFKVGLVPKDTGLYSVFLYFPWKMGFNDKKVPDYNGTCNRSLQFVANFKNLYHQPICESLNLPYREYLCIADSCDTLVYNYAFRVIP